MAAALAARGVSKGDRVLVQSKNCNQMFELMFACFRLGAVWVPTNFRLTPEEVAYLAKASGASAMICDANFRIMSRRRARLRPASASSSRSGNRSSATTMMRLWRAYDGQVAAGRRRRTR